MVCSVPSWKKRLIWLPIIDVRGEPEMTSFV